MVDLRLEDGDGLQVVERIREKRDDCRVVMLTGYGNIATAVAAVKSGAMSSMRAVSGWEGAVSVSVMI